MATTDTGLFLRGEHDIEDVATTIWGAPGVSTNDFIGTEAVRVGSATIDGVTYTHVGLRLFEAAGLLVLEEDGSAPDDFEIWVGRALSKRAGAALYLQYDVDRRIGGHALFVDGELSSRHVIDGRTADPVERGLEGSEPLEIEPENVWALMADALAEGAAAIFAHPVASESAVAALIDAADAEPIDAPADLERAPPPPARSRRRDRLRKAFGSLWAR